MQWEYLCPSLAWTSHAPFAFLSVELLQPRLLVELGTYYGTSYCAFCQVVTKLKLPTRCFAVDTWRGDKHTGPYSQDILGFLRSHHDPRFGSFSTLLQSTFDDALKEFADGSIDLLHIDGSHSYEDVAHDYHSWAGKMSDRGVVLMHDTAETNEGFGVHRLWAELEKKFPSFQFKHGHGLGVLAVGKYVPDAFLDFLQDARANAEPMREIFAALGRAVETDCELLLSTYQVFQAQAEINRYKREIGKPVEPISEDVVSALEHPLKSITRTLKDMAFLIPGAQDGQSQSRQ